jgi:2-phospho-L-lactate guanylyltransferase
MLPWVLISIKSLEDGKSSLSPSLEAPARRALNEFFLRHMVGAAADFAGRARTAIIGECDEVLCIAKALGVHGIRQSGARGLNAATMQGVDAVRSSRADEVLVVECDLTLVCSSDLGKIAEQGGERHVVICPDKRGTGTNAILLPARTELRFCFGIGSYAAHVHEAERAGVKPLTHANPRVAVDIDDPDDLRTWFDGPA